jgi:ABC-type lipoprotein release transport system permease subunit
VLVAVLIVLGSSIAILMPAVRDARVEPKAALRYE